MKKLLVLAVSAILVANISAQEQKKEGCKDKQLTKEERVEFEIRRFKHELMLSDQQAGKFAVTYREYAGKLDEVFGKNAPKEDFKPGQELTDKDLDRLAKARFAGMKEIAAVQEKYYDKFRQDLSARQAEKVMRLNEPFNPFFKPCDKKCGKPDGKPAGKLGDKHGHHGHHDHHDHPHK